MVNSRKVLAVVVAAQLSAVQLGARSDLFTEIFNRSLLKQKTVHSIRAKFTETTSSSLLTRPLVAHGTVVAASPGTRVLMTYTDPEPKVLTIDGGRLTVVWPARSERQQVDIAAAQARIDRYFVEAGVKDLRSLFDITADPQPGRPHVDRIDMRPRRKPIQQGLERLELWVDRDADTLAELRMTFPDGDVKTIELDEVTLNVPVTDQMFRGGPPARPDPAPGDARPGTRPDASCVASAAASGSAGGRRLAEPDAPTPTTTCGRPG
jgi:outer membrane lipoprotein-sorting protein